MSDSLDIFAGAITKSSTPKEQPQTQQQGQAQQQRPQKPQGLAVEIQRQAHPKRRDQRPPERAGSS